MFVLKSFEIRRNWLSMHLAFCLYIMCTCIYYLLICNRSTKTYRNVYSLSIKLEIKCINTTLTIVVFVLFCIHLFRKSMILFCNCIAINMTIFYAINVELNLIYNGCICVCLLSVYREAFLYIVFWNKLLKLLYFYSFWIHSIILIRIFLTLQVCSIYPGLVVNGCCLCKMTTGVTSVHYMWVTYRGKPWYAYLSNVTSGLYSHSLAYVFTDISSTISIW